VRPGVDDALGEAEVVVQRVQALGGVQEVPRVAEGDLGHRGPGLPHGAHCRRHLGHVVEGVEDPEDVDAGGGSLRDERVRHLGGVRRVADRVAPAQQHLERDVGDGLAQGGEAVPGVLTQEAQGDVVRRSAPRLDAQELWRGAGHVRSHREQVVGAHARGEQRLVRVAEGRVGHCDRLLRPQRRGERLRSQRAQPVA